LSGFPRRHLPANTSHCRSFPLDKLDKLPRFLRALAQTAGQMCNYSELGGQVGLDGKTLSRYISVLEQMYLLKRIDVWARNRLKRVVKTPKFSSSIPVC
jgi:uncharacterized protein